MATFRRSRSRSQEKRICADSGPPQPFKKVFLVGDTAPKHSIDQINRYKSLHQITVRSKYGSPPDPLLSFQDLEAYPQFLKECFLKAGFKEPTPIQAQGWPIALNGHDMIGIAQTGSGKTLAYLLPGMIHTFEQMDGGYPVMLILAPTRELTIQINEQFVKFTAGSPLKAACLYGGQEKYIQKQQLRLQPQVIVACPGRLIDMVESGLVCLKRVSIWVLDEADRMLDMGFEPSIRKIDKMIRHDRQTLLFSATWPKEVQNLAMEFCREDPVHLGVGNVELTTNTSIKQVVVAIRSCDKIGKMKEILKDIGSAKVIVFSATKRDVDQMTYGINQMGYKARGLHGDKKQSERDFIMNGFKGGQFNILVATDVASRGLDVRDIEYVINYDMPRVIEDYVHRIGRTGRAGKLGTAISLFCIDEDYKLKRDLIGILQESRQEVPQELLNQ